MRHIDTGAATKKCVSRCQIDTGGGRNRGNAALSRCQIDTGPGVRLTLGFVFDGGILSKPRFTRLAEMVEQRRQQATRASPVPNGEQTRNGNGSQTQQEAARGDFSSEAIHTQPPAMVGAENGGFHERHTNS